MSKVTEEGGDGSGTGTTSSEIVLQKDGSFCDNEVTFTNSYRQPNVNVTITNTVEGSEDTSEFEISASVMEGNSPIEELPEQPQQPDGITLQDNHTGVLVIKMAAGKTATITIPAGATLNVIEKNYPNYTTTYKVNSGEAGTSARIDSVKYGDTIEVINTLKKHKIVVYKISAESQQPLGGAVFTINNETIISGTDADTKGYTEDIELPVSETPYTLEETIAPAGYILPESNILITVSADGVKYQESKETANGLQDAELLEDGRYRITVTNSSAVELPNTGGSGTLPYISGGLMLVIISALMFGLRMDLIV